MTLMTAKLRAALPALYANEGQGLEALAQAHFFTPDSGWDWFASEFDGDDLCFGLVSGIEVELGYFRLSELREIRGVLGLSVEREHGFEPTTLAALMKRYHRH